MNEMRPLTKEQYAKVEGRRNLAALPFTEKVKCVIELQKRIQPMAFMELIPRHDFPEFTIMVSVYFRAASPRITHRRTNKEKRCPQSLKEQYVLSKT